MADTSAPLSVTSQSSQNVSKSALKKQKKAGAAKSVDPAAAAKENSNSAVSSPRVGSSAEAVDSSNAHILATQKQIRNVTKKLNNYAKLDEILAAHKGYSLDELVMSKKINVDQREQALRKPALEAQLRSLESQIVVYREIESEAAGRSTRSESEKAVLLAAHQEELEKVRAEVRAEAELAERQRSKEHLLLFSRFLAAAANRRATDDNPESEDSRAFEGALLLVYGGDEQAVEAAEKIIEGADEPVPCGDGTESKSTFARVKELTLADAAAASAAPADEQADTPAAYTNGHAAEPEVPASEPAAAEPVAAPEPTPASDPATAPDPTVAEAVVAAPPAATNGTGANGPSQQQRGGRGGRGGGFRGGNRGRGGPGGFRGNGEGRGRGGGGRGGERGQFRGGRGRGD